MAFLDNSGDIILDAVLTDLGRKKLARGNGTFRIVKFALGDEEINYSLFNTAHSNGSAFYDLEIMQTPILEAVTNNTSMMKSKLLSMTSNNLLNLPVLRLNNKEDAGNNHIYNTQTHPDFPGGYYLAADIKTVRRGLAVESRGELTEGSAGWLFGVRGSGAQDNTQLTKVIAIDQGLEKNGNPGPENRMSTKIQEQSYMVRVDHRLLRLEGRTDQTTNKFAALTESFVDDDGIALYYLSQNSSGNSQGVYGDRQGRAREVYGQQDNEAARETTLAAREVFNGPLGTYLEIHPRTQEALWHSFDYFDELGVASTNALPSFRGGSIDTYSYIDTLISVTGVTTGYSIDIPIRIIKGKTFTP